MKQYLFFFLASLVILQTADNLSCTDSADCSSECCGYYDFDLTPEGSSYFAELSASASDVSASASASSVETSQVDPVYICVSDSSADALDNSWSDYRKVCAFSSFMTVSAAVLAMVAY